MVLLQYGLPQVRSVCFGVEKVGWMDDQKVKSSPSVECKNQIFSVMAINAEPYHKRTMLTCNELIENWIALYNQCAKFLANFGLWPERESS